MVDATQPTVHARVILVGQGKIALLLSAKVILIAADRSEECVSIELAFASRNLRALIAKSVHLDSTERIANKTAVVNRTVLAMVGVRGILEIVNASMDGREYPAMMEE
jgi:hypothetical protein